LNFSRFFINFLEEFTKPEGEILGFVEMKEVSMDISEIAPAIQEIKKIPSLRRTRFLNY